MKKLVMVLWSAAVVAGLAAEKAVTLEEALAEGRGLVAKKEWAAAAEAYGRSAAAHPEWAHYATGGAASCLARQGKYAEAYALLDGALKAAEGPAEAVTLLRAKATVQGMADDYAAGVETLRLCLREYPGVKSGELTAMLGSWLGRLGRYGEVLELYKDTDLAGYEANHRAWVHALVGNALRRTGDAARAQEVFVAGVDACARICGTKSSGHYVVVCFSNVDPNVMGKEAYRAFLERTLLALPAVAHNAQFLGRVKSEFEKLRE